MVFALRYNQFVRYASGIEFNRECAAFVVRIMNIPLRFFTLVVPSTHTGFMPHSPIYESLLATPRDETLIGIGSSFS